MTEEEWEKIQVQVGLAGGLATSGLGCSWGGCGERLVAGGRGLTLGSLGESGPGVTSAPW